MKSLVLLFLICCGIFPAFSQVTGTIDARIFHNTSSTANSLVTYQISLSNGWQQGVSRVVSLVLKNSGGTTVYTHSVAANNYETISTGLTPGSYLFSGTVSTQDPNRNTVSVTITGYIWVGNKVFWENCFDMETGTSQYSVKRSKATTGQTYSYVQSYNVLTSGTAGWMQMSKLNSNINNSHVYWILEPMTNPRSFATTDNISYIDFYRDNSGVSGIKLKYKQSNGTYTIRNVSASATDRIRFERTSANACTIYVNNSTTAEFTFPMTITGDLKVTVLGDKLNDQTDEISTSFAYPGTNFPFATTFDAAGQTNTGDLTMRITPLSGFTAPYNYFVTAGPVADMKDIYKYLKDTVVPTTGVDSTTFFRGSVSNTYYTSGAIASGNYYASAFDSKGVRIYSNHYDVMPTPVFGEISNYINAYNEYISTSDDSYLSMNTYLTEGGNGKMTYYLTNTSNEQSFGFLKQFNSISGGGKSYSNLNYGFTVSGGSLSVVIDGEISTTISAKTGVPIEIVYESGVFSFRSEGIEIKTSTPPAGFEYKSGLYTKKWGIPIHVTPTMLSFKPYGIVAKVTDNACGKNSGDLQIIFSGFHGQTVSNINFELKNITDEANPVTVATITTANTTQNDLAPGAYLLEGSMTVGVTSYPGIKRYIYVGSKMNWDPYVNIETWPGGQTNSVVATSVVSGNIRAKAISTNVLNPQTAGWVVATPSIPSIITTLGYGQMRRSTLSLNEAPLLGAPATFDPSMPYVHFIGGLAFTCTSVSASGQALYSSVPNFVSTLPLMVVRTSTGVVKFRQNATVLRTVTNYGTGRWKPDFFTNVAYAGIRDVLSSSQCVNYNSGMYAQLKYDMDGYYHIMKSGEINFVFNQEYNGSNLTFNLYNSNDILIKTQSDFPALSTTNGMNYLTLLVRDSYCIGKGFFYLEVINSKNEKMYLRFFNDYDGCTVQGENPGGENQ